MHSNQHTCVGMPRINIEMKYSIINVVKQKYNMLPRLFEHIFFSSKQLTNLLQAAEYILFTLMSSAYFSLPFFRIR